MSAPPSQKIVHFTSGCDCKQYQAETGGHVYYCGALTDELLQDMKFGTPFQLAKYLEMKSIIVIDQVNFKRDLFREEAANSSATVNGICKQQSVQGDRCRFQPRLGQRDHGTERGHQSVWRAQS